MDPNNNGVLARWRGESPKRLEKAFVDLRIGGIPSERRADSLNHQAIATPVEQKWLVGMNAPFLDLGDNRGFGVGAPSRERANQCADIFTHSKQWTRSLRGRRPRVSLPGRVREARCPCQSAHGRDSARVAAGRARGVRARRRMAGSRPTKDVRVRHHRHSTGWNFLYARVGGEITDPAALSNVVLSVPVADAGLVGGAEPIDDY